eukprot:scaffold265146_cov29-Tisochrysis_lutea.AAC.1
MAAVCRARRFERRGARRWVGRRPSRDSGSRAADPALAHVHAHASAPSPLHGHRTARAHRAAAGSHTPYRAGGRRSEVGRRTWAAYSRG